MLKKTIRAAALAIGATALIGATAGQQAHAASCGFEKPISIAEMTWLSASTLAHVTSRIIKDGYGCDTKIVPGDTVPTASTILTRGEPLITPELWTSTLAEVWEKIQSKGIAFKAGDVFTEGGTEGWWIPDYVAKAHPDLKSVDDLARYSELFKEVASDGKGRLYACPPGWACEIVNNNLFKALDMESKNFEIFSPGSGANLKASIARKIARKQPLLTYYWAPTAVIGKYNLVKLDMPPYNSDAYDCLGDKDSVSCPASDFRNSEIAMVVATTMKKSAPQLVEFLSKVQIPNATINSVLAWGDDQSASPEEIATYFFKNYEDIWTQWVPADVATKVKAAL